MSSGVGDVLKRFKSGRLSAGRAMKALRDLPYKDIGFAKVDNHRCLRRGFPEVVFGKGKTVEQIVKISKRIIAHDGILLVTRAPRAAFVRMRASYPGMRYDAGAMAISYRKHPAEMKKGLVLIITAGTADLPVAEEARITLELMGNRVEVLCDVGVAGLHRLLNKKHTLDKASVIVVIAGMEGALASVVSGLV